MLPGIWRRRTLQVLHTGYATIRNCIARPLVLIWLLISGVQAFVSSYKHYNDDQTEYQWNRITLCAEMFSSTDMTFGFILFHEAVHMVSAAGDGNGDYSKKNLVGLALNKPDVARLTSNSYMLYTMQNSLSHDDYEKYSDGEGHSLTSLTCTNKWSDCHDQSRTQCASGTFTNGKLQPSCE